MGNKLHITIILILSLLLLIVPAGAEDDAKTVIVKGQAHIEEGRLYEAQDRAIKAGLRRAVERVAGTFISSSTRVKNAKLISDEILTQSQGYVKSYQVLDKSTTEDQYRVKLEVVVGTDNLSDDLAALQLNIKQHGNPRLMIVVDQQVENHYYDDLPESLVETELMSKFIEAGYQVIDRYKIQEVTDRSQRQAIINGDFKLASQLGAELEADLVVTGRVKASKIDLSDIYDGAASGLKGYNAHFGARVVDTGTAGVVASITVDGEGAGANNEAAAQQALQQATDKMGQQLIEKVSDDLINKDKTIQLKITGISTLEKLKIIENKLASLSDVNKVYFRSFNSSVVSFDLDIESGVTSLDVAYGLEEELDFDFETKDISSSKLILELN